MSTIVNAVLGIAFLLLAILATGLMFQFWGYPYDKENHKSACPQWKMNIHRLVGFAYGGVYIALMIQMVPRLWNYQVEFPARTVAHICLGITIGVLLVIKISILRFFRHFEEWMPALGVGILLCTFMLTGLSLPFVYKQHRLEQNAFTADNLKRVARLLPTAGYPAEVDLAELATEESLRAGREVLLTDCVQCHDLRTAISRPRVPADWVRTVKRMGEKPTLGSAISVDQQHRVAAFMIAITPDLQRSAKAKRVTDQKIAEMQAMEATMETAPAAEPETSLAGETAVDQAPGEPGGETGSQPSAPTPGAEPGAAAKKPEAPAPKPAKVTIDPGKAKATFERVCSQCHETSDVDDEPPRSLREVSALIARMIDNGLEAKPSELKQVKAHLVNAYVNK